MANWTTEDNVEDKVFDKSDLTMLVQPLDVRFNAGKKWRVTWGSNNLQVSITDKKFIQRIQNGLRISCRDTLKVRMHVVTSQRPDGYNQNDYTIVKVIKYIPFQDTQGLLNL